MTERQIRSSDKNKGHESCNSRPWKQVELVGASGLEPLTPPCEAQIRALSNMGLFSRFVGSR
jgi:hypothetical protein